MEAPHPPLMGHIGSLMAVEAFLVLVFAQFKGGFGSVGSGHVVFRGLEIVAVPLIGKDGSFVCHLPVGADRNRMAPVAPARGGYRLPCLEHGAAADKENGKEAGQPEDLGHGISFQHGERHKKQFLTSLNHNIKREQYKPECIRSFWLWRTVRLPVAQKNNSILLPSRSFAIKSLNKSDFIPIKK